MKINYLFYTSKSDNEQLVIPSDKEQLKQLIDTTIDTECKKVVFDLISKNQSKPKEDIRGLYFHNKLKIIALIKVPKSEANISNYKNYINVFDFKSIGIANDSVDSNVSTEINQSLIGIIEKKIEEKLTQNSSILKLDESNKIADTLLSDKVVKLNEDNTIPVEKLPKLTSDKVDIIDDTSHSNQKTYSSTKIESTFAKLEGAKIPDSVLSDNVVLKSEGKINDGVLSDNVVLKSNGKIADTLLSDKVVLKDSNNKVLDELLSDKIVKLNEHNKISDNILSDNVVLKSEDKIDSSLLKDDIARTNQIPSLSGYATESFVTSKGYLTQTTADSRYLQTNNKSRVKIVDFETVYIDRRYVKDNPFGNSKWQNCITVTQAYHGDKWFNAGWYYSGAQRRSTGIVSGSMIEGIVVQTGGTFVTDGSVYEGNLYGGSGAEPRLTNVKCRVLVFYIGDLDA